MKKYIIALAVVAGLSGMSRASGLADLYNSFANETKVSFLESGFAAYGQDINNGTPVSLIGTHLLTSGPLSLDVGLTTPLDASRTGTPLLGGSVSLSKLAGILFPEVARGFQQLAPLTVAGFADKLFIGMSGSYNINVRPNEKALMITPYAGLKVNF